MTLGEFIEIVSDTSRKVGLMGPTCAAKLSLHDRTVNSYRWDGTQSFELRLRGASGPVYVTLHQGQEPLQEAHIKAISAALKAGGAS